MDAPGHQPALRNFETASFAQQHILGRDANIVEQHFGGAVGHPVKAEDGKRADDMHPRKQSWARAQLCFRGVPDGTCSRLLFEPMLLTSSVSMLLVRKRT